jgi:predicted component of type VI protein secretion system
MMGIDPDSIDTVAELKSTINDLLDPKNENSLPAMRATLEASAKEYGIEDFSAITDEEIAAWSSADATPEQ